MYQMLSLPNAFSFSEKQLVSRVFLFNAFLSENQLVRSVIARPYNIISGVKIHLHELLTFPIQICSFLEYLEKIRRPFLELRFDHVVDLLKSLFFI